MKCAPQTVPRRNILGLASVNLLVRGKRVQPGRAAVAKSPIRCQAASMDFSRPRNDRMIAGVCAGIARRYGWEVSTARLLALLTFLLPGPNVLLYVLLWIVTPSSDDF